MKIKASQIKPGMVVSIDNGGFKSVCLVISTAGLVEVEYKSLDFQDSYMGPMVGRIKGKKKVKVIKGEQRKHIIETIKKDVFRCYHDTKNTIDIIRLIEAMGDGG